MSASRSRSTRRRRPNSSNSRGSVGDRYRCIEHRPLDDDGDDEPGPAPEPIPARANSYHANLVSVRMFADVVADALREKVNT